MAVLYRKRLIPQECILLDKDTIVHQDNSCIITTWDTLRPKNDFVCGISLYHLTDGVKISYFLKEDGSLLYIYCDIIEITHTPESDTYIFTDLLADVIIENDGKVRVVDLDELAQACEEGIIEISQLTAALYRLDRLLKNIDSEDFSKYTRLLDAYRS